MFREFRTYFVSVCRFELIRGIKCRTIWFGGDTRVYRCLVLYMLFGSVHHLDVQLDEVLRSDLLRT